MSACLGPILFFAIFGFVLFFSLLFFFPTMLFLGWYSLTCSSFYLLFHGYCFIFFFELWLHSLAIHLVIHVLPLFIQLNTISTILFLLVLGYILYVTANCLVSYTKWGGVAK
jgi:hypothetical protein